METSQMAPSKRPGLLDEIDRTRFIARKIPQWGEQAVGLLWKRQQHLRLLAVVVSLSFIVAVLSNSGLVIGIAVAGGGGISVLLIAKIHSLCKTAKDLAQGHNH